MLHRVTYLCCFRGTTHVYRAARTVAHQRLSDCNNSFKGRRKCLSTGEGFLADLMRLWLGLLGEHVADHFSISNSLFSLIFKTWINVLSFKLKEVFPWPSSDMIIARAPLQSRKYPSTRVVINCTELFIQQLLSLQSQAIAFYTISTTIPSKL